MDGIFLRRLMFPRQRRGILSAAASCRGVTPIATEQEANLRPFVSLATLGAADRCRRRSRASNQLLRLLTMNFLKPNAHRVGGLRREGVTVGARELKPARCAMITKDVFASEDAGVLGFGSFARLISAHSFAMDHSSFAAVRASFLVVRSACGRKFSPPCVEIEAVRLVKQVVERELVEVVRLVGLDRPVAAFEVGLVYDALGGSMRRTLILGTLVAASIAASAFGADEQRQTCCVTSGECQVVDSDEACSRLIDAYVPLPVIDPPSADQARQGYFERPSTIAPAVDVVELRVIGCDDLPRDEAPIPPGAVTLERLRWFTCATEVAALCGIEPLHVAWPRYSDGHLGDSPLNRDPSPNGSFRVRLEERDGWVRVRGAEAIDQAVVTQCE